METYLAIPTEKSIFIDVNFDHSIPSFDGRPKYGGLWKWLEYGFGTTSSYLKIKEDLQNEGDTFSLATAGEDTTEAWLYWSPGNKDLVWQARYWAEIKAQRKDGKWQAEIPARYAGLPKCVFMNVANAQGQMASTLPLFKEGTAAKRAAFPRWDGEQLWDVKSGLGAWRPIVTADPTIPRNANLQFAPPYGLVIGPDRGPDKRAGPPGIRIGKEATAARKFVVVTSSIGLVAAEAARHAGLAVAIHGCGAAGELKLSLVRNFHSIYKEEEFTCTLHYSRGMQKYSIPWKEFRNTRAPKRAFFPSTRCALKARAKMVYRSRFNPFFLTTGKTLATGTAC